MLGPQEHYGDAVVIVPEPVDVWKDGKDVVPCSGLNHESLTPAFSHLPVVNGHNLLGAYYGNQKRWAFSFQTFAIFSRLAAVREALANQVSPLLAALLSNCVAFCDVRVCCTASLLLPHCT